MFSYNKLKDGNGVINLWALLTLFRYYMVNSVCLVVYGGYLEL